MRSGNSGKEKKKSGAMSRRVHYPRALQCRAHDPRALQCRAHGPKALQCRALMLIIAMIFFVICTSGCKNSSSEYKKVLDDTQKYLMEIVSEPVSGSVGGEWAIIGLAQSDAAVPEGYYEKYLQAAETYATSKKGILHTPTGYKYTEYSRVILGVTAAGGSGEDVAGYNFLSRLTFMDNVCRQGINGPIWALIAFDCQCYELPHADGYTGGASVTDKADGAESGSDGAEGDGDGGDEAKAGDAVAEAGDAVTEAGDAVATEKRTSREALIEAILDGQLEDGGWDIMGAQADPDMTAMALQALAPYYTGDERFTKLISEELLSQVKLAVDSGLEALSDMQTGDGSFESWGSASAESCAQVVVALSSLGIDSGKDSRFVKDEGSLLEALLSYHEEDGGFSHVHDGGTNQMATEQCFYALVAYDRFVEGKRRLYDFN